MSIHVPTGFRLNCRTIAEAEAALENTQKVAKCLAAHLVSCRFHDWAALFVDQSILQLRAPGAIPHHRPLFEMNCSAGDLAWAEIVRMGDQKSMLPEMDFDLTLQLFMHDGIFCGICDTQSQHMLDGFMASEVVEPMGYSDASPMVAQSEVEVREMRRRIWQNILKEGVRPMTCKLVEKKDYVRFPALRTIDENVVSFDLRKRRLASAALHAELRESHPQMSPSAVNAEILDRFDDYVAETSPLYDQILPREIATEAIISPLNEVAMNATYEAPRQVL